MNIPWWLSILAATIIYTLFSYLLPNMESSNPEVRDFLQFAPQLAPVLTIPLLLLGAKQLYDDAPAKKEQKEEKEKL